MQFRILLFALLVVLASCARAPLKGQENAMRRTSPPELSDDLPVESLLAAVTAQIKFFEKWPGDSKPFVFGEVSLKREDYLSGLKRFVELGRTSASPAVFLERVKEEFDFYEVYGQKSWGEVFVTSYFEPVIPGSLKATPRFSQPLYQTPDDLLSIDLAAFDPRLEQQRKFRGRLVGKAIMPYFSRREIDSNKSLKGRKLEICWVDPIDAFFLQVQGSGTIELEDRRQLRVNYAEKNGHPYESLSNHLKSRIPLEQMNMHTIEAFLRSLPASEAREYLERNPSYVFFRTSQERAVTYLGIEATDGRTIATDPRYFPKGALAFLHFEKPVFNPPESLVPSTTEPAARFVLDQDIGGAIQGPGRVDLFWGRGADAKRFAGAMKFPGKLYYLVPKTGRPRS
ncbi:MAG: hypothetical protein A2428_14415 [Bdellovibrionales bacterium RIFOXYC1_FULL_54_43]|nr:MAG: hypothetical protein A2428_14415 [Bdellovibrionales bacterium RIFOXYC1_FULL_54_43]OFZ85027.1 MAG: hypothetical protein A2603_04120 [Bdellovibrionales bacterium RIFOXYD1_FULL_55_31]